MSLHDKTIEVSELLPDDPGHHTSRLDPMTLALLKAREIVKDSGIKAFRLVLTKTVLEDWTITYHFHVLDITQVGKYDYAARNSLQAD